MLEPIKLKPPLLQYYILPAQEQCVLILVGGKYSNTRTFGGIIKGAALHCIRQATQEMDILK